MKRATTTTTNAVTSLWDELPYEVEEENSYGSAIPYTVAGTAFSSACVTTNINGHRISAVMDTGSKYTLVAEDIIKQVYGPNTVKALKDAPKLQSAGGVPLNICGTVNMEILVADIPVKTRAIVVKNLQPSLLFGYDDMAKNEIILDLKKKAARIQGREIPLQDSSTATAPQTKSIPACQEHSFMASTTQNAERKITRADDYVVIHEIKALPIGDQNDAHPLKSKLAKKFGWPQEENEMAVNEKIPHREITEICGERMRRNRNGLLDLQFKVKWKESGDISWVWARDGKAPRLLQEWCTRKASSSVNNATAAAISDRAEDARKMGQKTSTTHRSLNWLSQPSSSSHNNSGINGEYNPNGSYSTYGKYDKSSKHGTRNPSCCHKYDPNGGVIEYHGSKLLTS
jgi:hypothetical protein